MQRMVNDDKPFLKITENGVLACGSPWMGTHGLGSNIQVPLKAIRILERGSEPNTTKRLSGRKGAFSIWRRISNFFVTFPAIYAMM